MRKSLLSLIVGLSVLLAAITSEPAAYAQRRTSSGSSHSSSGRSYSSGSSSSSRTSSSSHSTPASSPKPASPSRPSNPAPSRPSASGKSYSSGARSAPAASSYKQPSGSTSTVPEKRSTPTPPRQNFPANTRPRSTTFDEAAAAAQQKEQSRIAYTKKSTPANTGSAPGPVSPAPTVHPSGKTYSKNGYDSAAAQAQRREESRITYQAGTTPKPTYRTPAGNDKPIEPSAPQVEHARRVITPILWGTRQVRMGNTYGPYFGMPTIVYNDPYNSWFWYWLLSRNLDSQAYWTYHHRYDMDQARYNDLLSRNAQLATRVNQLEQSKLPRDAAYTPEGIDPDLMYADNYVEAAFNPQVVETSTPDWPEAGSPPPVASGNLRVRRAWKAFWEGIFAIAATAAITFLLIWLIFIKRWGGDKPTPAPSGPRRRSRR